MTFLWCPNNFTLCSDGFFCSDGCLTLQTQFKPYEHFSTDSKKMSKRTRTSSKAYHKQPFALALTLEQHTSIIMSCPIVVERNIKLADIYDSTFEGRTFPKVVKHVGWVPLIHMTCFASKNNVRDYYCAILWARNLKEPSMKVTIHNV